MSSKIETLSGRFVDPLAPNPDDIDIRDIAHALAHQCRFNGYTSRHYSVAEHSVYVAQLVRRYCNVASYMPTSEVRIMERQALLHDATEAYLLDMPTPLKRMMPDYKNYEKALWRVIAEKFKVPFELHPFVKEVDGRMCSTEKLALLSDVITEWKWGDFMREFPPYVGDWDIIERPGFFPPTHSMIRRRFLDFYEQVKEAA